MTLDSQCQAVLDAAAKSGSVFDSRDPREARARYSDSTAVFAGPTPEIGGVEERAIKGLGGDIPVRLYYPQGGRNGGPVATVAFFHGGGWVFGDLDSHDHVCRHLAAQTPALVVAVDYRRAPESKFPQPLEDCLAGVRWLMANAADVNADAARIAVAGDSAGGNMAAAVCQVLRDSGEQVPKFQLLIYPATDLGARTGSIEKFGQGYLLTRDGMTWCMDSYLRSADDIDDPRASPLRAPDLSNLPPAHVITAGFDPLRDEGIAYANRLTAAGVPVSYQCYDGMIHGFMRMTAVVDVAVQALGDCADILATALAARS